MLLFLWQYHVRSLGRYFKTRPAAKTITFSLFVLLFISMGVGISIFFEKAFWFIKGFPYLEKALIFYVFELFFLLVSYLVFLSALLSGLFIFWRRNFDNYFMAGPAFGAMPWYVLMKTTILSFWPLVVLAIPALLGISKVVDFDLGSIFVILLAVLLLIILVVALAFDILFLLVRLLVLANLRSHHFGSVLSQIFLGLVILMLVISYFVWLKFANTDLSSFFDIQNLNIEKADIAKIDDNFKWLPSHLAAQIAFSFIGGVQGRILIYFIKLFIWFTIEIFIFWLMSKPYLLIWQVLQEGRFVNKIKPNFKSFPRFLKGQIGAIFEKEMMVILRNPRHLLWSLFLVCLWFIQIMLNFVIRKNIQTHSSDIDGVLKIVQAAQLVVVVYFISAFILRFVFPAFSTERNTAWILGSSPIKLSKIFGAKLLFFSGALILLGVGLSIVNSFVLSVPAFNLPVFLGTTAVMIFFAVVFGLSLGTIFPNFGTDDPEILSTSLPGLGFVLGTLIYGGLGATVYYYYWLNGIDFRSLAVFIVVSFLGSLVFLALSFRFLKNIEFKKSS